MPGGRVVVAGSANLDVFVRIDRRPAGGETLMGSDAAEAPGGKGANQAVACARLGGNVRFAGRVGDDPGGTLLRRALEHDGVDTSTLRTSGRPTGRAFIFVTPDGENSIIVSPGANQDLTPDALLGDLDGLQPSDVLLLQLEIPLETVRTAIARAETASARAVLNAAPARPLPADLLALCNPLVANESEALLLLDRAPGSTEPDGSALVRDLLALGPRSVVVTMGGVGAFCGSREHPTEVAHVPAHQVTAVDTTGAGDAFVGALVLRLAGGDSLEAAMRYGNDVGAIAVQGSGAQPSYPRAEDVEAMR